MKEYKFIVPIIGSAQLTACADTAEEALEIILEKQEELESLPYGHVDMDFSKVIVIENEINECS